MLKPPHSATFFQVVVSQGVPPHPHREPLEPGQDWPVISLPQASHKQSILDRHFKGHLLYMEKAAITVDVSTSEIGNHEMSIWETERSGFENRIYGLGQIIQAL